MKKINSPNLLKYYLFIVAILITSKFIFADGIDFLSNAFKPLFIACIFIYLFGPLANLIDRKTKINRVWSVVLSYVALILVFVLFIILIVPSIIDSINLMITNISSYNEKEVINFVNSIPFVADYIEADTINELVSRVEEIIVYYSSSILSFSTSLISSISSAVYSVVIFTFAILMSFYALVDTDNIDKKLVNVLEAFLPDKIADRAIYIIRITDDSIKKYLVSKSYTCIILGIMITITVYIVNLVSPLNIPYAPLMGFLIGLSNFIPYIGFFFGTLPCVIIAAFTGFPEALGIFIIINGVQQIDNLIVSPKIIGDKVGVSAFWVLVSVIIGGSLFGMMGMILSIPIVSVILRLIDEHVAVYQKNHPKKDGDDDNSDGPNNSNSTKPSDFPDITDVKAPQ